MAENAAAVPGVEVHGTLPEGKVVVVIEGDTIDQEVDRAKLLREIEGVIDVQVAYHNFEDVQTTQGGVHGTEQA